MNAKTVIRGRTCAIIRQPDRLCSTATAAELSNRAGIGDAEFAGEEPEQFFGWVPYAEIISLDFRPAVLRLPLSAIVGGAQAAAPLHFLHKDG